MNAVVTSGAVDNGVYGSDSDSNSDDLPEYYHPISTAENNVDEDEGDPSDLDLNHRFHQLPNGLSPLDLSDDDDLEDDEEEEAVEATESERAIERAFREDERRRTAPLPADNAVRVMEAMRRISFGGDTPDWAARVPEDQWIGRLRSLSRSSN
ncbi:hypothetical protein CASFOL_039608 [Castilleja foliolosa]|uniref:Uncharacterized protein n=1 Tax=Castilleja foliolosa TaxID=1961234 RepID=A0ABD3BG73_9LAMI